MATVIEKQLHPFDAAKAVGREPYKVADLVARRVRPQGNASGRAGDARADVDPQRAREAKPLAGTRIMGSLHMTIQTAVLIETLTELGADVRWVSCNIFSTQDHAAAAVVVGPPETAARRRTRRGRRCSRGRARRSTNTGGARTKRSSGPTAPVRPRSSTMAATRRWCCTRVSSSRRPGKVPAFKPESDPEEWGVILELIRTSMAKDKGRWTRLASQMIGVSEETTTGVHRLYQMQEQGKLMFPAINVNDSVTKSKFDNIYGCRHSLTDGLCRASDVMLGGKVAVVFGFGEVGKGCAQALRGQGCRVIVTEIDPICALQAAMEGYEVNTLENVVSTADIFITTTGNFNIITAEHMAKMKDKAIVGNIGHFDNEIDMAGLKKVPGIQNINIKPQYDEWKFPDGHSVMVLAEGPSAQPRMRHRPPELRDVGVVHQPDDRAARALRQPQQVREQGLHPAEAPRREGGAAAPRSPRREADEADEGTGRLPRRARRRAVQAGPLSAGVGKGQVKFIIF